MVDMGTKTVAAQVEEDTDLYQWFDQYSDDFHSKSEAVRAALRREMEDGHDEDSNTGGPELGERLAWGVLAFSLAAFALGYSLPAGGLAAVAGVVFIGVAVNRWKTND